MVQDLSYNLCESLVENIGGVAGVGKKTPPTPITYLTQWEIVGNSEVHTLPYPDGVVLPNGYKRCEYIESHSTEYINLGFNSNCKIELKAQNMSGGTRGLLLGNSGRTGDYVGFLEDSPYPWMIDISDSFTTKSIDTPQVVELTFSSNALTAIVNSESKIVNRTPKTNNFLLFTVLTSLSQDLWAIAKVWYLKVFNEDTLVHHWIPCLDDNNVPCMYDVIGEQTYYNAGTGTFDYKLYHQPTEIWSCGEYNATDNKYHILIQPLGGSIADIALNEPLRKVNDVADTIEFPSGTDGKALVTRKLMYDTLDDKTWTVSRSRKVIISEYWRPYQLVLANNDKTANILVEGYTTYSYNSLATHANAGAAQSASSDGAICLYDDGYLPGSGNTPTQTFYDAIVGKHILLELATPTTELVDAPQIEEAESYSMIISQGAKAVEWSSFETE